MKDRRELIGEGKKLLKKYQPHKSEYKAYKIECKAYFTNVIDSNGFNIDTALEMIETLENAGKYNDAIIVLLEGLGYKMGLRKFIFTILSISIILLIVAASIIGDNPRIVEEDISLQRLTNISENILKFINNNLSWQRLAHLLGVFFTVMGGAGGIINLINKINRR